ncbi:MAG: hypothetical protein ACOC9D_04620 [Thermodesulfobacteriota bacterium]
MNSASHKTDLFAREPCLPEVILQALKIQARLNMQGEVRPLERIFGDLLKPDINKGNLLNYALVPLHPGIGLSFQLELMLVENREFLLTLNEHFALFWKNLTFSFDPKIIIFYQLLLLAISSLAAALVLNKIALRHQSFRTGLGWRKRWPVFLLAGIFSWLSIAG